MVYFFILFVAVHYFMGFSTLEGQTECYKTGIFTVGFRFLEPPRETKIGSRNREVREIEGKDVVFD